MSAPSTTALTPGPSNPAKPQRRMAFLLSRGWISAILGALVGSALCFLVLAPWQFSRNAERTAKNVRITTTAMAQPVALDSVLPAGATATDAISFRPVTVTGQFAAGQQVAVGLRQNQAGQASLEILTPLRLTDGTVLLVDRGYVSASTYSGSTPLPPPPDGTITVTGRVQPFQPDPLHRPAIQRAGYLEVRGIAATSVPDLTDVRGGFIQLTQNSPGVLTEIGVPQVDSGPFLSYAWQWMTFGTMALLALSFFVYRETVDPREVDEDLSGATDSPGAESHSAHSTAAEGRFAVDAPDDSEHADSARADHEPAERRPAGRRARPAKFDRSQLYDA